MSSPPTTIAVRLATVGPESGTIAVSCAAISTSSTANFSSTIGITLEYRLAQHFSLQASSEPSTLSLLCRPGITTIGNRPRQFGFDLFRDWSF